MNIITLVAYDIKKYCYSKKAMITMLLLPIVMIFAVVQVATAFFLGDGNKQKITLFIVDNEQSFYTKLFVQKIIETPSLQENVNMIVTDEISAKNRLIQNEGEGMIIIPSNFTKSMQEGTFEPIIVVGNKQKPLESTIIREGMQSATNLMSAAQSAVFTVCDYARENKVENKEFDALFQSAAMSFSLKALGRDQIFTQKIKTPWMDMQPFHFYSGSLLILFIFMYGLQGMHLYFEEKQTKVLERMKTFGVEGWKIIFSKWIALTIWLFIQISCIAGVGMLLTPNAMRGNIGISIFTLLMICACISAWTFGLAVIAKTEYVGSMLLIGGSIVGALVGGGIIPYPYMPSVVEKIGKLTLHYWGMQGVVYSFFTQETMRVLHSVLLMSIITIGCIAVIMCKRMKEGERK